MSDISFIPEYGINKAKVIVTARSNLEKVVDGEKTFFVVTDTVQHWYTEEAILAYKESLASEKAAEEAKDTGKTIADLEAKVAAVDVALDA